MEDAHTSGKPSFLLASSHARGIHGILNCVDSLDKKK